MHVGVRSHLSNFKKEAAYFFAHFFLLRGTDLHCDMLCSDNRHHEINCSMTNLTLIIIYCIFQPALAWWALQMLVETCFSCFSHRKAEKEEKSKKIAAKNSKKKFFLSLHQNAGGVFYSQKNT